MWVINKAVGCHYFPPGLQLPPQPLRGLLPILLLDEQRHNKWWGAGLLAWLFVWSDVQICIWPSWCHCHSLYLASVKSRLVLPYWYRLTWVVPDKGPLNGCVCVNRGTMGVSSLPKTVNRQRRDCDLNPGSSVPESSTLTTCYRATPKLTVTREKCSFGGRRHVGQLKHSELQSQHHGCTQHLTNWVGCLAVLWANVVKTI